MTLNVALLRSQHESADGQHLVDCTGDQLPKAGFHLNRGQEQIRRSSRGKLIEARDLSWSVEKIRHRHSQIDALLIQSRGQAITQLSGRHVERRECTHCDAKRGPFKFCINLNGQYFSACGNCKWDDRASLCTFNTNTHEQEELVVASRYDNSYKPPADAAKARRDRARKRKRGDQKQASPSVKEERTAEDGQAEILSAESHARLPASTLVDYMAFTQPTQRERAAAASPVQTVVSEPVMDTLQQNILALPSNSPAEVGGAMPDLKHRRALARLRLEELKVMREELQLERELLEME